MLLLSQKLSFVYEKKEINFWQKETRALSLSSLEKRKEIYIGILQQQNMTVRNMTIGKPTYSC
ncbi:hypothetical protein, partial [Salmonella sp. s58408]|uniref:hypothetical protein n=1 Tax=Salmonella sp. s58408 TaxID=3159701 RepID=UPI0039814544